eukprot:TRINITY_DN3385_c0_g3_i1.p1 TRINITY_DN3385_c0_g3~~TRINITY_DN3385_c0_g3_i1.p1  ORF type:complete len:818 (+),score=128.92 TRINITY_DN3385_c0_g3_i1:77-2530(+)
MRSSWFVNDFLDIRDGMGKWLQAQVKQVGDGRMLVHFVGWDSKWDEWISFADQERIADCGTFSAGDDTEQYELDEWVEVYAPKPEPARWIEGCVSEIDGNQLLVQYQVGRLYHHWFHVESASIKKLPPQSTDEYEEYSVVGNSSDNDQEADVPMLELDSGLTDPLSHRASQADRSTLYVGKLTPSVTNDMLLDYFSSFGTVTRVTISLDNGNRYGLVMFENPEQAQAVYERTHHTVLEGDKLICRTEPNGPVDQKLGGCGGPIDTPEFKDEEKEVQQNTEETTLFVSKLPEGVTEHQLHQHFCSFGNIIFTEVMPSHRCGFVGFETIEQARSAAAVSHTLHECKISCELKPRCIGGHLLHYTLLSPEAKKNFRLPHRLRFLDRFRELATASEGSVSRLQHYEVVRRVKEATGVTPDEFEGRLQDLPVTMRVVFDYKHKSGSATSSVHATLERECQLLSRNGKFLGLDVNPHPNILVILDRFSGLVRESDLSDSKQLESKQLESKQPESNEEPFLDTYFCVSPYCPLSLKQLLDAQKRVSDKQSESSSGVLTERVVLHLALGIAAGLYHLHRLVIVHRDVRPDNILLYWSPDLHPDTLPQVKNGEVENLSDEVLLQCVPIVAGFSASINRKQFQLEYMSGVSLGGAPAYLPPEIRSAEDDETLDYTKSDVYGLGCVMYQMMKRDASLPLSKHSDLSPEFSRDYQEDLCGLVAACTRRDPTTRCSLEQAFRELVRLEAGLARERLILIPIPEKNASSDKIDMLDSSSTVTMALEADKLTLDNNKAEQPQPQSGLIPETLQEVVRLEGGFAREEHNSMCV